MTDDIDIAQERAIADAATPGPWTADVDSFGNGEIDACVSNHATQLLFTAGTEIAPHHGASDGKRWTDEDSRKNDAQWNDARKTQPMRDATFIARARTLVPRLLDALEQARKERDEWQRTSESWRFAHFAWQQWGEKMRPLVGGTLNGDEPTRNAIEGRALRWRDGRDAAQLRAVRAENERDALRQQLEAVTRERDEAVQRTEAGIAAFVEKNGPYGVLRTAEDIRAGAWRKETSK